MDEKKQMLTDYFTKLYNNERSCNENMPAWFYRTCHIDILHRFKKLDGYLVRAVVYKLKKNKTCANHHIVGKML